jgi:hypothetical protein
MIHAQVFISYDPQIAMRVTVIDVWRAKCHAFIFLCKLSRREGMNPTFRRLYNHQSAIILPSVSPTSYHSNICFLFINNLIIRCRSKWSRGLRHEMSSPARMQRSWVRIPFKAWMFVYVYFVFVLSCVK